jgi:3-oxoacyl-[acyl-carrier protein] reductase
LVITSSLASIYLSFLLHSFFLPSKVFIHQIVKMPGRLDGQIAIVTGSTQGFGKGILDTFVREGAVVLGLDLLAQDGPVEGFTESQAYQLKADVTDEAVWKKAVCSPSPPIPHSRQAIMYLTKQ